MHIYCVSFMHVVVPFIKTLRDALHELAQQLCLPLTSLIRTTQYHEYQKGR